MTPIEMPIEMTPIEMPIEMTPIEMTPIEMPSDYSHFHPLMFLLPLSKVSSLKVPFLNYCLFVLLYNPQSLTTAASAAYVNMVLGISRIICFGVS